MGIKLNIILDEIQTGTFHNRFPYQNIDSKNDFIRTMDNSNPEEWVVEKKYDGWFSVLCELGLFSKTGTLIHNDWKAPHGEIYVGEYLVGTQWALKRTDKTKLVIHWSNKSYGSPIPAEWGYWIPRISFNDIKTNWNEHIKNFEGLVLKNIKTRMFYRWKQEYTGDYVIIGCLPSDAVSYRGVACGAIAIGLYKNGNLQKVGTVGGGLNLTMRKDMFQHPEKYVGKVVQITGKAVFASGLLRHPNYDRIREDKLPEMCTMNQFEGLL